MALLEIVNEGILYINPDPAYHHVSAFFPSIVQLSDQELICLYQFGEGIYAADSTIALQRSVDGGETWSEEGLLYDRSKDDQPGFMVVLSNDGGHTWDLENQIRIWDATGWTHIGLNRPKIYPRSHDTIAFGAPSIITMMNGDLFASWWCTYASQVHTRWARIRAG